VNDKPPGRHTRRAVLGTLATAAAGSALGFTATPAVAAPTLVWSPNPATHGLNAFEGLEDDRAGSHPGVRHIYVESSSHYRFDMHTRDRDGSDRQRNESKGMRNGSGQIVDMMQGETWRLTYDMYIPTSLKGTTSFTHIFQLKRPGSGTGPLVTISLQRSGSTEYIAFRGFESGVVVGRIPLAPLKNHWFSVDMTFLIRDAGRARFIVRDGGSTVMDKSANIDIWLGDRIRPKWGIYRSLSDSSQLQNTYLLIRNYKAYRGT
jgi:hypothetical protein